MKRNVLILAAGKSKRMKSKTGKFLHPVLGKPIIRYVVEMSELLDSAKTVVIVNNESQPVRDALADKAVAYAVQEPQLGTGHAVMCGIDQLEGGSTLILLGDAPCIRQSTLVDLFEDHEKNQADLTVLSVNHSNPYNYGRILRRGEEVIGIREHRDCSPEELLIPEINSGVFLVNTDRLKQYLPKLSNDNAQQEYYITDLLELMSQDGLRVRAHVIDDETEVIGINNRAQLWDVTRVMQQRINQHWMVEGVTMLQPESIFIDADVSLSPDVTLLPGTHLRGTTVVAEDAVIGPNAIVTNCQIGEGSLVESSTIRDSIIGCHTTVGPYAYMRPGSVVGDHVKVGDFVETKNVTIGHNTKISHLSYIGDGSVGENVNIGCGTIFVNYDGQKKHRTTIEDNAFIGCNSNLVAPVTVGKGAYVGAGTTVTRDVPADALAVGRVRQSNKEGWAKGKNKAAKE